VVPCSLTSTGNDVFSSAREKSSESAITLTSFRRFGLRSPTSGGLSAVVTQPAAVRSAE
jgi:hypothetical protein